MSLKQSWDEFLRAIGLKAPPGMVTMMPRISTGTVLDDPFERARLMRLPPTEQTAMLAEALKAAPEYRAQLAEASDAWGTWKQHFVVKQMRQALGPNTTKEEIQTLIDAYRRLN